ncbi:hypothetical protein NCCP1664_18440 [Zafaria cholistanensis]|uniref:Uncharacterized protein n=1 Tax=Zafaria cholistanensis TaxID=1682741 RepID=A0A5A7NU50_9MICC|nr:hypothetical protein NCCP1664_18440 [Zafaria cholistanensis]
MGYYNDLAFHLRRRHLSDAEVARILNTVRRKAARAKVPPLDAVGPAGAYARTFPRASGRRTFPRVAACLYVAGALFALFVGFGPEVPAVRGVDPALLVRELGRFPMLRLGLPYLFLVAAAHVVYLCRLPAGFRKKPGSTAPSSPRSASPRSAAPRSAAPRSAAPRTASRPSPRSASRPVRAGSPPRSRRG